MKRHRFGQRGPLRSSEPHLVFGTRAHFIVDMSYLIINLRRRLVENGLPLDWKGVCPCPERAASPDGTALGSMLPRSGPTISSRGESVAAICRTP